MAMKKKFKFYASDFSFYNDSPYTHLPDYESETYPSRTKAEDGACEYYRQIDGFLSCSISVRRVK